MRTRALIQFRLSRERAAAALPEALRWIARAAVDDGPSFSQATVEIGPDLLEELLRWGRVRTGDVTRMRIARLEHSWSREELGNGMVELADSTEREAPEVVNRDTAFAARWSCACCDRIDVEQVASLEVTEIDPDADLQLTGTNEVLLAARLRKTAERLGAVTRSLAGSIEAVQLVTPPVIQIAPVFPLVPVGERCSCCGRQAYDRSDHVEGSLSVDGDTGLVVAQEWPLTIEATSVVAGQSAEPLNWRGRVSGKPIHTPGEALDPDQVRGFSSGLRPSFVSLILWDALATAGARLSPGRPVKGGSKS